MCNITHTCFEHMHTQSFVGFSSRKKTCRTQNPIIKRRTMLKNNSLPSPPHGRWITYLRDRAQTRVMHPKFTKYCLSLEYLVVIWYIHFQLCCLSMFDIISNKLCAKVPLDGFFKEIHWQFKVAHQLRNKGLPKIYHSLPTCFL